MRKHLSFSVDDELARMIASDLKVPYTIVDKHTPFEKPKNLKQIGDPSTLVLSEQEKAAWLNVTKDKLEGPEDDLSATISRGIAALNVQLIELAAKVKESKAQAEQKGSKWNGPTDSEIADGIGRKDWDAAFHCEWLRVVLRERFSMKLDSPSVDVNGVKVAASATGEAWVKHWWVECVDQCGPWGLWCCHWHQFYKWTRIASITKKNIDVLANTKVSFAANPSGVVAKPRFTKLRLDYDILREIPLEDIANWLLDDPEIAILSNEDMTVEMPALGLKYRPAKIEIPQASGRLLVNVEVTRA